MNHLQRLTQSHYRSIEQRSLGLYEVLHSIKNWKIAIWEQFYIDDHPIGSSFRAQSLD